MFSTAVEYKPWQLGEALDDTTLAVWLHCTSGSSDVSVFTRGRISAWFGSHLALDISDYVSHSLIARIFYQLYRLIRPKG